jgi:hypothetical protein
VPGLVSPYKDEEYIEYSVERGGAFRLWTLCAGVGDGMSIYISGLLKWKEPPGKNMRETVTISSDLKQTCYVHWKLGNLDLLRGFITLVLGHGPPLWSSVQSSWLQNGDVLRFL